MDTELPAPLGAAALGEISPSRLRSNQWLRFAVALLALVTIGVTAFATSIYARHQTMDLVQRVTKNAVECQHRRRLSLADCWNDPTVRALPAPAQLLARSNALKFALLDQIPTAHAYLAMQLATERARRATGLWHEAVAWSWAADDIEGYAQALLDESRNTAEAQDRLPPQLKPRSSVKPAPKLQL
ncbi:MAG: hypothetical protein K0Q43_181 [Ramlibacter sp.]|jgi:hypothetical protein|nr:hypothetical protein [Ramlibacter sp.]